MPSTEPRQPSRLNPRRISATRSVSLRHSPGAAASRSNGQKRDISQASSEKTDDHTSLKAENSDSSPSSLLPLTGRGSSGETSNADRWFDQSNNDVRDNSASFADNDPPFFMRNGSSSESPPDVGSRGPVGAQSLPLRTGLMNLGTDGGSSNEDFRGVIDDLTIENKKLKRRLKKYEKLHDAHLKNEKLFEIRIHGLEPEKKRELEDLLRTFAGSLSTKHTPEFPANGYEGLRSALKTHQTASSHTSLLNTDSAYASMSASGQGSSVPSGGDSRHKSLAPAAKSRQQNINSFLHNIPEGLLPQQHPEAMSERVKQKLVVRRLEQIFAGTDALAGPHHQALQQQDVSQMAAHADRTAIEARGQQAVLEGQREAAIMQNETEEPVDNRKKRLAPNSQAVNSQQSEDIAETDFAQQSFDANSEEQRPTRPLDLDPDRAQVPSENLRYIRHLGFSPQDPEGQRTPEEGHGWVYLNLLVNMAQLHTIHVTPEFVRKAVTDCSDHFEVSADGRKVRWRGGPSLTRGSSYGGDSSRERTDEDDAQSPRKKLKVAHGSLQNGRNNSSKHASSTRKPQQELGRLMYTPLFSHRSNSASSDFSSDVSDGEDSPYKMQNMHQIGGESSAMTSSGIRTATKQKKPKTHDSGPIIFYNNAGFCTDLSGDAVHNGNTDAPSYKMPTVAPVGSIATTDTPGTLFETRGPLEEAKNLPEPMDLADNPIPDSLELSFPQQSPPQRNDSMHTASHVNLEVTGMGGVYPADNFAITVESRHSVIDQATAPAVPVQNTTKNLPGRFASLIQGDNPQRKVRAAVTQQYLNVQRTEHPPSVLPPALCYMPSAESSNDDVSEEADEMSLSPASPNAFPPSAAPQTLHLPDGDSEDSDEEMASDESEASDAESDGSLDLLATAREADPEAVLRKERQYDAEMAERLAEDIPAGSSAATAGGGSGFASPADGVDKREYRQALKDARERQKGNVKGPAPAPPSLERAHTSDSMDVQGIAGSDASVDEADDEDDGSGS